MTQPAALIPPPALRSLPTAPLARRRRRATLGLLCGALFATGALASGCTERAASSDERGGKARTAEDLADESDAQRPERSAPAADTAAPDTAASDTAAPSAGSPAGLVPLPWPLRADCATEACLSPSGAGGVRCAPSAPCGNPCPPGMAPESNGSLCAHTCSGPSDCPGGRCLAGVCNRQPPPLTCDDLQFCELPGGQSGVRCQDSDPCRSPCKPGLVLFGGTHCAKPCRTHADCPGGTCEGCEPGASDCQAVCGPLCPSEGCPYRWE